MNMKKIVNLYCITYGPHNIKGEMECIDSAFRHAQESKYNVRMHVCDNNSPKEFTDWLKERYSDKIVLHLHPENIGKARIVNLVHSKNSLGADYIVSMDGDMVIENENTNFFDELILPLGTPVMFAGQNRKVKLSSSVQNEHTCHRLDLMDLKYEIQGKEFITSSKGWGIAGGCMAVRASDWNLYGGYYESPTIFGGNDGILVKQVYGTNGVPVIAKSALCRHLKLKDTEEMRKYQQWKVSKAKTVFNDTYKPNSGFFEKQL
jgi:glycosyltransferase involved in cell wall biosynthesis